MVTTHSQMTRPNYLGNENHARDWPEYDVSAFLLEQWGNSLGLYCRKYIVLLRGLLHSTEEALPSVGCKLAKLSQNGTPLTRQLLNFRSLYSHAFMASRITKQSIL